MQLRVVVLCLWTIAFVGLIGFQVREHQVDERAYVQEQIDRLTLRIEATAQNLENFSAYTLQEVVEESDLASILFQVRDASVSARDALRGELYASLHTMYQRMTTFDFRQLHVHLPDLTSFLRMHALEKNGDYLGDVRHTVRIANEEQRIVRGFEEGRIFNGFRFVYPVSYEGTHVGTIEVSVSMASFLRVLAQMTAAQYLFVMEREVVERVVFADEQSNYYDSYLAPSLLFDRSVTPAGRNMVYEAFFQAHREELDKELAHAADFGIFGTIGGRQSLVIFKSLKNLRGEHVGYIVSVAADETQQRTRTDLVRSMVLLAIGIVVIQTLSWIALTDRRRLKVLAGTDQLTGVMNRHSFERAVAVEMERSERYGATFGFLILDIDHFKLFNDTHGHNEGDRALRATAHWIRGNVRSTDLGARWGGEEFVVAIHQCDRSTAVVVAEKLCRGIADAPISSVRRVTVSIGVAMYRPGDTVEALVGRADDALYRAKRSGRNRVEVAGAGLDRSPASPGTPTPGTPGTPGTPRRAPRDSSVHVDPARSPAGRYPARRVVRVALRTASNATPTSAITASHIVASPTVPRARKPPFTARAMTMF
jgi:diguanylate cyclase (GGDEF)-like protein